MLFHCRAVKLPAVFRQTSDHTAVHHGGHSSAHVQPKPSGACHSTRNKKDQNDKVPLGSPPDILHVDTAEKDIEKPKEVQRRQVGYRGKCFEPAQAPICKTEEPKLTPCSVVVGLEKDMENVAGNDKPKPELNTIVAKDKPKPKSKKMAADDKPKQKSKKIAADDKPKPKSKKIVAESVTPKEKSKENVEPKEQSEKHVEIPKEKSSEVVSTKTQNVEPSYEIEHVAVYINNGETQDTEDGHTKEEKIQKYVRLLR